MGLQEKRAITAFQENTFVDLVKEINAIAGYEPEVDVKWDTLAVADYGHLYNEGFTKVYFDPLIATLKEIAADDLGIEALKETLKKIIIKNEGNFGSPKSAYSFADGVLTIDHSPITNINDVAERTKYLVQFLSSKM